MKMAAMNGLTITAESFLEQPDDPLTSDPDVRAPKDERRKDLEAKLAAGQVFVEFEQVPKKRVRYEVAVSTTESNIDRNRFKDVLPYDDNRVKLTPSKSNPLGYINASHIRLKIADENWWYIAAQGPMDNTAQHFWQMVWEQEVEVIAMLTKLMEHGKPKCFRYWPEARGPKHALKFGDYQVSLKFTNVSGSYCTSGLFLYHKRCKKERLVWHLQYTDWPDHGCPEDPAGFLDFLNEIDAVRRQRLMEKRALTTIPVLIHCTAGVGRSGVTILTEIMKACFEFNEMADVPTMLMRLREQRMYLVQTVSQYSFIYQTLVEYLKGSRLI
ncbi:hypothetical protein CAPTEDRAFT_172805 [Capitella teleta]|uniref:Protein-tyrosine-phosphatase n=1 Tax=Capitella teleta TaxID=283909 RepID=R7TZ95_CAPTE|nr:hypothetical protein CAPTEDRAFT_172805 [Capitella teleta]|eukprot:ELT96726.1 hypothetical protein CAPTEDRAFT_172805 [Capitella teleta]